ncbi:MAG: DUF2974 domain-containing protein [Spirochaetaceae bacterium]|nr:DUF2974 domain-containing protein [Spirochaetaceae bacterium]
MLSENFEKTHASQINTISDYFDWRGDLSFEASPINEVDCLIFCQLSYLDYSSIVSESFAKPMRLKDAAAMFENAPDFEQRKKNSETMGKDNFPFLKEAAATNRFGGVLVSGFSSHTDDITEKQFAAITFEFAKNNAFIAFRGTDGTIVGWKEDFNMAFMSPVPAQKDAVAYLTACANADKKRKLIVGGHSKGGNLAIYSSVFCDAKTQKQITKVYNFDGPGFEQNILQSAEFTAMLPKLTTYLPQSSVVGILFNHREECIEIKSSESMGIFQHDPFTWFVTAKAFVKVDGLTNDSKFIDSTIKDWLEQLDNKQREMFIDTLFEVLYATEARTLSDLSDNGLKKSSAVITALARIEPETRIAVLKIFKQLLSSAKQNIPLFSEINEDFKRKWNL